MYFVVYKYTFNIENLPCSYIGSKSNCYIKNGLIYNKRGKLYKGSIKDKDYLNLWEFCIPELEILYYGKNSKDILEKERKEIIERKAHTSEYYFNKSIPCISNFTFSNFSTFYDIKNEEYCRVSLNDPRIFTGQLVGTNKNKKLDEETKQKISKSVSGENNGFYGKTHTEDVKAILSEKKKGNKHSEEFKNWFKENVAHLPASEKQKKTASESSKNKVMLKNINTGENIKIDKNSNEYKNLDKSIWKNPFALSKSANEIFTCPHCGKECKGKISYKRWHGDNCKLINPDAYERNKLSNNNRRNKDKNKTKSVVINGARYESIKQASEKLEMSRNQISWRIKSEKFSNWYYYN